MELDEVAIYMCQRKKQRAEKNRKEKKSVGVQQS